LLLLLLLLFIVFVIFYVIFVGGGGSGVSAGVAFVVIYLFATPDTLPFIVTDSPPRYPNKNQRTVSET